MGPPPHQDQALWKARAWGGHDMGPGLEETALGKGAALRMAMGGPQGEGGIRNSRRKRRRNAPPTFSEATAFFIESDLILPDRQCSLHIEKELTRSVTA